MSVQIKSVSLCSFGIEESVWDLLMTSGKSISVQEEKEKR